MLLRKLIMTNKMQYDRLVFQATIVIYLAVYMKNQLMHFVNILQKCTQPDICSTGRISIPPSRWLTTPGQIDSVQDITMPTILIKCHRQVHFSRYFVTNFHLVLHVKKTKLMLTSTKEGRCILWWTDKEWRKLTSSSIWETSSWMATDVQEISMRVGMAMTAFPERKLWKTILQDVGWFNEMRLIWRDEKESENRTLCRRGLKLAMQQNI